MSALLLEEQLYDSKPEDYVRRIANVRTLTVLPRLDGKRKARVLQFLYDSCLIDKDSKIIKLGGADLGEVNLFGAVLSRANLRGAGFNFSSMNETILYGVDLDEAFLLHADLSGADLSGADLTLAHLEGIILKEAILRGATGITNEELEKKAKSLEGAIMPDGTKHA